MQPPFCNLLCHVLWLLPLYEAYYTICSCPIQGCASMTAAAPACNLQPCKLLNNRQLPSLMMPDAKLLVAAA